MNWNFIVHHACEQTGGEKYVLANFPFFSEMDRDCFPPKKPFLADGYYFWEYNLEQAIYWGQKMVKGKSFVIEAEVSIDIANDELWLDLVGNRKHLVDFVALLKEFDLLNNNEHIKDVDLCDIIDYLRNECPIDVFPFKVIRAVDLQSSPDLGKKMSFNVNKRNFTLLNPKIIISYIDKNDIVHRNKPKCKFAS